MPKMTKKKIIKPSTEPRVKVAFIDIKMALIDVKVELIHVKVALINVNVSAIHVKPAFQRR